MRLSKKGRTVSITLDFWWNPEDQTIHIGTNDPDPGAESFRIRVTSDASRRNAHLPLFEQLAKCLRSKGAPAP
jgi:hypothetical protein